MRLKTDFPLYLSGRQLSSSCCLQVFRWFQTGGAVTVSSLTTHPRRCPALPRQWGSDEPRHGASGRLVRFWVRTITRVCGTMVNMKTQRFLHGALSGKKRAEKVPFEKFKNARFLQKISQETSCQSAHHSSVFTCHMEAQVLSVTPPLTRFTTETVRKKQAPPRYPRWREAAQWIQLRWGEMMESVTWSPRKMSFWSVTVPTGEVFSPFFRSNVSVTAAAAGLRPDWLDDWGGETGEEREGGEEGRKVRSEGGRKGEGKGEKKGTTKGGVERLVF